MDKLDRYRGSLIGGAAGDACLTRFAVQTRVLLRGLNVPDLLRKP